MVDERLTRLDDIGHIVDGLCLHGAREVPSPSEFQFRPVYFVFRFS
jgi:hypothetical protein